MKKLFCLLAILLPLTALARVTMPHFFSDNMIVQQRSVLTLRGTAAPGASITATASWGNEKAEAQADATGNWKTTLTTPAAGGPFTLTVDDGSEPLTFSNVLVGEVWLCSGQSNMEMPVAGWGFVKDYEKEIAAANYPNIRLLNVEHTRSFKPADDITVIGNGTWTECTSESVQPFSAAAYFFARELWQKLGIPVGVINASWGGTPCESWVPYEWLADVPGYEQQMADLKAVGYDSTAIEALYIRDKALWENAMATADKGVKVLEETKDRPTFVYQPKPFEQFLDAFDGMVWFTRTIDIPTSWAGKEATLHLGRIDDEDITFWNDSKVGSVNGWINTRTYSIPSGLIKSGANTITIRIQDTGGDGGMLSSAEDLYIESADGSRLSLAGDWRYAISYDNRELPQSPIPTAWPHFPACLYNSMIHPFLEFPVQGAIWYQGCSNVGRNAQYEPLFQALIRGWREAFQRPDMPFYFVQLANYLQHQDLQPGSDWAQLREAQARAKSLPNVGMACAIEIGEANDIHPKNKQEVGRRLAALALHNTYGQSKVVCGAPVYEGYSIEGQTMRIRFSQPAGTEPFVASKNLSGFSIQDKDGTWYVADAHTDGNTVVVSHPSVQEPVAARYGWADNPTCTLSTKHGFPVPPFRTDWVETLEK